MGESTTKSKRVESIVALLVVASAVLFVLGNVWYTYGTRFEKVITVHRAYTGTHDGDTHYFIESTQEEIFEVDSSILMWFFTPAEVWNEVLDGHQYRIRGFGMRVGALGWYPTVYAVQAV